MKRESMFQRILVALDGSTCGEQAWEEALKLAQLTHANLMLVRVLLPSSDLYPLTVSPTIDLASAHLNREVLQVYTEQEKEREQMVQDYLKTRTDAAIAQGVVAEYLAPQGDPGQAVCDLARSWQADLVILGRRGRKGLEELLLGSVSNYVTHHAPCSVLTVQQPQAAEVEEPVMAE